MLGKLVKNEFKATGRIYLPLFGVLLLFTIINKLFILVRTYRANAFTIPQGIVMTGYVMVIVAIAVITLIMAIQRFHKNLLGDEGYLMFTLPVKPWQLIVGKLVPAIAWSLISFVVAMLSIGVLVADAYTFSNIANFFRVMVAQWSTFMPISMFSAVFYTVVGVVLAQAAGYLMIYLSIGIGHQANKNRMLAGFGAFLVISIIIQIVMTLGFVLLDNMNITRIFADINVVGVVHVLAWATIIPTAIFCALAFWGTNFLLSKHLNLE